VQIIALFALLVAYLFGSVPFGLLFARVYRVDIRKVGSGNIGATNVQRALGWGPALTVLVLDALKGGIAILFARFVLKLPEPWVVACGAAAVLGHNYSVFLKFKGGKGVATSVGTMIFIEPLVGILGVLTGMSNMVFLRIVSGGSLTGAIAATMYAFFGGYPLHVSLSCLFLALLMLWMHRENISRMQNGTERRLGEKKVSPPEISQP